MKKIIFLVAIVAVLTACGEHEERSNSSNDNIIVETIEVETIEVETIEVENIIY